MSRTFFFEVLIGLMQARRMGFKELAGCPVGEIFSSCIRYVLQKIIQMK